MTLKLNRLWALAVAASTVLTGGLVFASSSGATSGRAASSKPTIALTMSYTGNSWGQLAQQTFIDTAKQLEKQGKISAYYTSNANNSASTQASQITDYVLKKVSAIIVEASSPTGLNGAIAQAHAAHIPVVVVETGPVTSPYAYELNPNVALMGYQSMEAAIKRLHGKGNILYVQGVAGNPFTVSFKQGVEKAAKAAKGVKLIVGPFGNWTDSTSDSQVAAQIPSLPKIDAVISEGGEYGAVEALIKAGRPVPIAIGDNRGTFLQWWWKEYQSSHHKYNTESLEANPWVAGAGAYVALDILAGQNVPKTMTWPTMVITNPATFRKVPASHVAAQAHNATWVEKNVIHGKG